MKTASLIKSFATVALATGLVATSFAQLDPDPDIFDAQKNGGGSGGSNGRGGPQMSVGGTPLGGMVSVLDESRLPPLGSIVQQGIQGAMGGMSMPGGMSGSPMGGMSGGGGFPSIPMGGSQGGQQGQQSSGMPPMSSSQGGQQGQQSQSNQTPLIPMPGANSQSQSQSGQQGQQGEQGQQGQSGEQGQQGQSGQAGQQGQQGGMAGQQGQMPPPPPDVQLGDPGMEIGATALEGVDPYEDGESAAGGEGGESGEKKKSGKTASSAGADNGKEATESDDQEMPDGIGGSQSTNRGRGTEEGKSISTRL